MDDWVLWNVTGPVWLAMKRFSVFFNKDARILVLRRIKTKIWPWLLDRVKMALCEKMGRPNLFELSEETIYRLVKDDNIRLSESQITFMRRAGEYDPDSRKHIWNQRGQLAFRRAEFLFQIMKDVAVPRFMMIGNSIESYREDRAKTGRREVKIFE